MPEWQMLCNQTLNGAAFMFAMAGAASWLMMRVADTVGFKWLND